MQMKVADLDDSRLLEVFIALRDRRGERKKQFDEADADDKAKQEKIEAILMDRMTARGIDSMAVKGVGTAYKSTRVSYTVRDAEAVRKFVEETGHTDMLDLKINKTFADTFVQENNDLPPGVNRNTFTQVNIRRS